MSAGPFRRRLLRRRACHRVQEGTSSGSRQSHVGEGRSASTQTRSKRPWIGTRARGLPHSGQAPGIGMPPGDRSAFRWRGVNVGRSDGTAGPRSRAAARCPRALPRVGREYHRIRGRRHRLEVEPIRLPDLTRLNVHVLSCAQRLPESRVERDPATTLQAGQIRVRRRRQRSCGFTPP